VLEAVLGHGAVLDEASDLVGGIPHRRQHLVRARADGTAFSNIGSHRI
jgi:hypothetical protein